MTKMIYIELSFNVDQPEITGSSRLKVTAENVKNLQMRFCKKNSQFIYMLLRCIAAWSLGTSLPILSTKILPNWPGNSPDLNLIRNFWLQMKNMQRREHATSIEGLKRIALMVW